LETAVRDRSSVLGRVSIMAPCGAAVRLSSRFSAVSSWLGCCGLGHLMWPRWPWKWAIMWNGL